MERSEWLELCRQAAMLSDGDYLKKTAALQALYVVVDGVDGVVGIPYGYELWFAPTGKAQHNAILHDVRTNTLYRAWLDTVRRQRG